MDAVKAQTKNELENLMLEMNEMLQVAEIVLLPNTSAPDLEQCSSLPCTAVGAVSARHKSIRSRGLLVRNVGKRKTENCGCVPCCCSRDSKSGDWIGTISEPGTEWQNRSVRLGVFPTRLFLKISIAVAGKSNTFTAFSGTRLNRDPSAGFAPGDGRPTLSVLSCLAFFAGQMSACPGPGKPHLRTLPSARFRFTFTRSTDGTRR